MLGVTSVEHTANGKWFIAVADTTRFLSTTEQAKKIVCNAVNYSVYYRPNDISFRDSEWEGEKSSSSFANVNLGSANPCTRKHNTIYSILT